MNRVSTNAETAINRISFLKRLVGAIKNQEEDLESMSENVKSKFRVSMLERAR